MRRPAPAPARVLRGCVVAGAGLLVAVAGHAYAGGSAAPTPAVVIVALLVSGACVLVSDRRWTPVRLVTALLGMQVATHAALWFDTGARTVDSRLGALAGGSHEHTSSGSSPAVMLLAHLVAVAVAAALLAGADRALMALHALARRLRRAPLVAPAARPRPSGVDVRHAVVVRLLELGAVGRRGPPAVAAPS